MPNQLVVEEIDEHEAYFQIIGSRFPTSRSACA